MLQVFEPVQGLIPEVLGALRQATLCPSPGWLPNVADYP